MWGTVLLAVAAIALGAGLVLLALRLGRPGTEAAAPAKAAVDGKSCSFRKKTTLLNRKEQHFYRALADAALELNLHLFVKVRLADILEAVGEDEETKSACMEKLRHRKVDFLLCRDTALAPVLVVELDDQTHDWRARGERDSFKEKALTEAGLGILHVKSAAGLREKLAGMVPLPEEMAYDSILPRDTINNHL